MKVEIIKTEGYGLLAEVRVGEQLLGVMDDFSMVPVEQLSYAEPEFSYLGLEEYSWEQMFSGNLRQEKKLVRTGDWSYEAYGQIVSIKPVIADFGLFKLELGDFTNDQRCIGEWIVERIDRLDLTFRTN